MKIHVGNLSSDTKSEDLQTAFEAFGAVAAVNVITDKHTGEPRGFAFVEMSSSEEGNKAIAGLNEQDMNGNAIKVSEARSKGA
jgi:cold-inducible RNA-binding protein